MTNNQQGNLTQIYPQVGNTAKPVSMAYDALGRVTSVSYGTSATRKTENYLYDDEGLRIRVWDGTTYKYNIYNEARQLVAQYEKPSNGNPTWKRSIVYVGTKEIGEISANGNSTTTSITLSDHLGTPRYIWDGSTLTKQKFMPFGEQITDPTSANKFAKGFTGHEQTDLSNPNYMQARFYVPWYGKFASPDPGKDQHFEFTQSWNVYSYTRNNPINLIDPTGMWGKKVHYDLTMLLAYAAGYDMKSAIKIAKATLRPDEVYSAPEAGKRLGMAVLSPNPGAVLAGVLNYRMVAGYHFTKRGQESVLEGKFNASGDLNDFGEYLHLLQDEYNKAHAESDWFHCFTWSDNTRWHEKDAMEMAEKTYDVLSKVQINGMSKKTQELDFDIIKSHVKSFIKNPENGKKLRESEEEFMLKVWDLRRPIPAMR